MHAYCLIAAIPDAEHYLARLIASREPDLRPANGETVPSHPDILICRPPPAITIAQIRHIIVQLSRKPFALRHQYIILFSAEEMTLPAQQAFLKNLEELDPHHLVFLVTDTPRRLLPTILSRCRTVRIPTATAQTNPEIIALWSKLLAASPGQQLQLIAPFTANRSQALDFVMAMTRYLETLLRSRPDGKKITPKCANPVVIATALRHLIRARQHLHHNCHPALSLDQWVLSLPGPCTST